MILGKLNRSRKRKEGRKTATIVVIWVGLGKEVSEQEGEFLGLFFFFLMRKKNEVRNVGRWFLLFFSFETKSNSLTTLNLQFSHFVSWE